VGFPGYIKSHELSNKFQFLIKRRGIFHLSALWLRQSDAIFTNRRYNSPAHPSCLARQSFSSTRTADRFAEASRPSFGRLVGKA